MMGEASEIKESLGNQRKWQNSEFDEEPKPVAYVSEDEVVFRRSAFRTLY